MGQFVGPVVEAVSHNVAALSDLLRHNEDDSVRWEAAEALGELGEPIAIPALLSGITDLCYMVRLCVAEALGLIGQSNSDVIGGLCCLLTDPYDCVRRFALEALGDLGDSLALPNIQTRLVGERGYPMVRLWAHYALYRLEGDPFPFTEAITHLRIGTWETRCSAAAVLVRIATPANTPRIRAALERAAARETSVGMRESMGIFLAALDSTNSPAPNPGPKGSV